MRSLRQDNDFFFRGGGGGGEGGGGGGGGGESMDQDEVKVNKQKKIQTRPV